MPRPSLKEKILTEGLRVVHERGFAGASVRDIVQAAGVPLGSFSNHFSSKEAFGVEVLNLYYGRNADLINNTLRNDALPPLKRLRAYIDAIDKSINQNEEWYGCLLGNFGAEVGQEGKPIQRRVCEIFKELEGHIEYCLHAAVKARELPAKTNCKELAGFIYGSLQGAFLQAKTEHSSIPMERFKRILFGTILR
jgi:TetR/AcrR family transcriptional repressor of nem operon